MMRFSIKIHKHIFIFLKNCSKKVLEICSNVSNILIVDQFLFLIVNLSGEIFEIIRRERERGWREYRNVDRSPSGGSEKNTQRKM